MRETRAQALVDRLRLGALEQLHERVAAGPQQPRQRELDGEQQALFVRAIRVAQAGQLGRRVAQQHVGADRRALREALRARRVP